MKSPPVCRGQLGFQKRYEKNIFGKEEGGKKGLRGKNGEGRYGGQRKASKICWKREQSEFKEKTTSSEGNRAADNKHLGDILLHPEGE